MVALVAIGQYAARADAFPLYSWASGYGDNMVVVYEDFPLPFHMNGGGHPGTVKLLDNGRVIDSERIDDVTTVHDVRFDQYNAYFHYVSHGTEYQETLRIIQ
jgi:hypothetical protein